MPVTYYTKEEYDSMKRDLENQVNQLCFMIKDLKGEPCNKYSYGERRTCCGKCQFNRGEIASCTSNNKYFSK